VLGDVLSDDAAGCFPTRHEDAGVDADLHHNVSVAKQGNAELNLN
jgi:hypothetical protein